VFDSTHVWSIFIRGRLKVIFGFELKDLELPAHGGVGLAFSAAIFSWLLSEKSSMDFKSAPRMR